MSDEKIGHGRGLTSADQITADALNRARPTGSTAIATKLTTLRAENAKLKEEIDQLIKSNQQLAKELAAAKAAAEKALNVEEAE